MCVLNTFVKAFEALGHWLGRTKAVVSLATCESSPAHCAAFVGMQAESDSAESAMPMPSEAYTHTHSHTPSEVNTRTHTHTNTPSETYTHAHTHEMSTHTLTHAYTHSDTVQVQESGSAGDSPTDPSEPFNYEVITVSLIQPCQPLDDAARTAAQVSPSTLSSVLTSPHLTSPHVPLLAPPRAHTRTSAHSFGNVM